MPGLVKRRRLTTSNKLSPAKLHKFKWSVSAGGIEAKRGTYGYTAPSPLGTYHIWPPGAMRPREGYSLLFANDRGVLPGGLWHRLKTHRSPAAAKRAAQEHLTANWR